MIFPGPTEFAQTYYIYDDLNNLVCVIPPEAVKNIVASSSAYFGKTNTEKESFLNQWAFRYKYDEYGRLIEKKVPGSGRIFMVYDKRNRLVLTQDSIQRTASPYKWSFTKYDDLNRPIITGEKDTTVLLSQSAMQNVVNAFYDKTWNKFGEAFIGNTPTDIHGYSNKSYPKATSAATFPNSSIRAITYYDDYQFRSLLSGDYLYVNEGLTETRDGKIYELPEIESTRTVGQITGTKVRVLDGGYTWLSTVNYYDDKYRLIQSVSDNYQGGSDRATNLYDFAGRILASKKRHYGLGFKDLVNIKYTSNKLAKTIGSTNWGNSGAASKDVIPSNQDGWLEFVAGATNQAMMVGFSQSNTDANWNTIQYALYLTSGGKVEVREAGSANLLSSSPNYYVGNVFRIERSQGMIKYYLNGTLLRQVNATSGALLIDLSINGGAGVIYNLRSSIGAVNTTVIGQRFEYDHATRLIKHWHRINDGPEILLTHNQYNERGQLVDKKLHSTVGSTADARQSIDYRYNIRGWLMSMNNSGLNVTPSDNDDSNDYFGFNLSYNETSDEGNSPLFNGNISSMRWSKNLGLDSISELAYTYQYDALDRLISATHKEKNSPGWSTPSAASFSEPVYAYDLNGNITNVIRYDERGATAPMDNLIYDYGSATNQSNKLLKVTEKTGTNAGDPLKGFVEGGNTDYDYSYDGNGNMTIDRNRGITTPITYNHLNLPTKITKGSAYITYRYDATGRKLGQETYFGSGIPKYVEYLDEFVYENGVLQFINHAEGRTMMLASPQTIYQNEGDNLEGMTGSAPRSLVTLNGNQTYVEITNPGTGERQGAVFGGTIAAQPGERYLVRAKGYRAGSTSVHLINRITINGQITDQGLLAQLPLSVETESWIEHTVTIPPGGTHFYIGLVWHPAAAAQKSYVNDFQIIKLGAAPSAPEYQYHLKDHLGNVRLTFTTKPKEVQYTATIESNHYGDESADFPNYDDVTFSSVTMYNHTNEVGATRSVVLNGAPNKQVGLTKSLSVLPGDTIDLEVYAKYYNPESTEGTGTLIASAMTSAFGLSSSSIGYEYSAYQSLNGMFNTGWVLGPTDWEDVNAPKAFLNYILFDEDFIPYDMGWDQIDIDAAVTEQTPNPDHDSLSLEAVVTKPGYIYIYFSNEEQGNVIEVYFDDLNIRHRHSPVIQADDYYPFGLTFNSYQRENSLDQKYLYNGKELQDELNLGWLDYGARMYAPEIGRFQTIDPLSETQLDHTPFHYTYNSPIRYSDPSGMTPNSISSTFVDENGNIIDVRDDNDRNIYLVHDPANWNGSKEGLEIVGHTATPTSLKNYIGRSIFTEQVATHIFNEAEKLGTDASYWMSFSKAKTIAELKRHRDLLVRLAKNLQVIHRQMDRSNLNQKMLEELLQNRDNKRRNFAELLLIKLLTEAILSRIPAKHILVPPNAGDFVISPEQVKAIQHSYDQEFDRLHQRYQNLIHEYDTEIAKQRANQ